MKKVHQIALLLVYMALVILPACNRSTNEEQTAADIAKEKEYQFLEAYPIREVSFTDSTDISFNSKKELSSKERDLLKIEHITKDKLTRCIVNYRLNLSDNYKTIVFCVFPSENEIKSILVNYDKDYNIIDHRVVAYDEVAEGLLNTYSIIQKSSIETVEQRFGEESNAIDMKTFELTSEGKILAHK